MGIMQNAKSDYDEYARAPRPILVNEFEAPREPARIKTPLKVGDKINFLGVDAIVSGFDGPKVTLIYIANGFITEGYIPFALLP